MAETQTEVTLKKQLNHLKKKKKPSKEKSILGERGRARLGEEKEVGEEVLEGSRLDVQRGEGKVRRGAARREV